MRIIQQIKPDIMIAEFLLAEIISRRFKKRIAKALTVTGYNKQIITQPDTTNKSDNQKRIRLLSHTRGYPVRKNSQASLLFEGLPADIKYYEATITRKELEKLRFINHEHWQSKLAPLRIVAKIAAKVAANPNHPATIDLKAVREKVKKEKPMTAPILLASSLKARKIVILEGNLRLSAYYLEKHPGPFRVILAVSPYISQMKYY